MVKISVIMGIYNCSTTLSESLDSLLAQTVTDWELIMCDDGSSDQTVEIALSYCQKWPDKMKLLQNKRNLGLNKTLNRCLQYATGKYIARQDGDDISSETRFEEEMNILDNQPEVSIVSSTMLLFDDRGVWGQTNAIVYPDKKAFLKGTPFCHAASMTRKKAYDAVHGYSESDNYLRVEDYDLWLKMYVAGFRGINIIKPLYQMRDDRNAASRRKLKFRINESRVIIKAIRCFHLPFIDYIYAARPIIVGLIPNHIYQKLHRRQQKK